MKIKAAVLVKQNEPLQLMELDIPTLQKGQVLVKILYSGICRSQLNEMKGFKGADKYLPHLLGHEGVGEVVAVGFGVTKVQPGDRVVISWIKGSGLESKPAVYKAGKLTVNSGPVVTFAECAIISENRLTKISKNIPAEIAALLGCALATGAGITFHVLPELTNKTVAVVGTGGIGLSIILGAKMKQARQIIAIDIHRSALRLAKKLGATQTFLYTQKSMQKNSKEFPGGFDYVVEASGTKAGMEFAYIITADKGWCVVAGNLPATEKISINPFDLIKGKRLLGTWGGEAKPDEDFPRLIKAYTQGTLLLDQLIYKKYRLREINTALTVLEKYRHAGRMLIDFT